MWQKMGAGVCVFLWWSCGAPEETWTDTLEASNKPILLYVFPENRATHVAVNQTFVFEFSAPMAKDTVQVRAQPATEWAPLEWTYLNTVLRLTPKDGWKAETEYVVTLTGRDAARHFLKSGRLTFTTGKNPPLCDDSPSFAERCDKGDGRNCCDLSPPP